MEISHVNGVRNDISEMLSKIREMSNKSTAFSESTPAVSHTTHANSFENVMAAAKNVVSSVNDTEISSEKLKNAYIAGDQSVSMSQVVVAAQKSKLAFEGLVSVRNKILEAYKEVMNMPV